MVCEERKLAHTMRCKIVIFAPRCDIFQYIGPNLQYTYLYSNYANLRDYVVSIQDQTGAAAKPVLIHLTNIFAINECIQFLFLCFHQ